MIKQFEETGFFFFKFSVIGRKSNALTSVEDVVIAIEEGMWSGMQKSSVRGISQSLSMLVKTVHEILRNILLYYPYKITRVEELLPADLPIKYNFTQEILAPIEVDNEC